MPQRRQICDTLEVESNGRSATLFNEGRPLASFRGRASSDAFTVSLVLPTGREQDVSRNPRTIGRLLRGEATRLRRDPNRWFNAAADQLSELLADGAEPTTNLDDTCALLAFPLLRSISAVGARPPARIPAWVASALRQPHIDTAFVELFGRPITRGLRRAMRDGLLAGATTGQIVSFAPLAIASTMPYYWPVDHVATVLRGDEWLPPAAWPSDQQRADLHRIWPLLPHDIGTRLATESLETPTGPDMLWSGLRLCETLLGTGHTPPTTITGLHQLAAEDARRQRLPVAAPEPPGRIQHRPQPPQQPAPVFQPHIAPQIDIAASAVPERTTYCVNIELLDGLTDGDHRYSLPRSEQQLIEWGELLESCIADYIPAVRAGRSSIVGQFHNGRLVAALELTDTMQVRQFVGHRNRPPTQVQRDSCHRALTHVGLGGLPGRN